MTWPELDFNEFDDVLYNEWKEKTIKDLKGRPFEDIHWTTRESTVIEGFYSKDHHLGNIPIPPRSHNAINADWQIREKFILSNDAIVLNEKVLTALEQGVTALDFTSLSATDVSLDDILKGVFLEMIHIYIDPGVNLNNMLQLKEIQTQRMLPAGAIKGGWNYDPILELELYGKADLDKSMSEFAELLKFAQNDLYNWKCVNVQAGLYYNAGANAYQEIAFALSKGIFYVSQMVAMGLPPDAACATMQFTFAMGPSYFKHAAKIRAFRYLWSKVAALFELETPLAMLTWINTEYGELEVVPKDKENNYLRMTSETMSAVVGGADSITAYVNESIWGDSKDQALRTVRNIQHVTKEEAYFAQVNDPGKGSFYIEGLTRVLAEQSWEYFKEIMKQGGHIECLLNGWIQSQVDFKKKELEEDIKSGKKVIIGLNKFQNPKEPELLKEDLNTPPPSVIAPIETVKVTSQTILK